MSFKSNVLANYASQIYVTLVSILVLPLYVKYMGAEAYGLIGFFAMLQAWFNLLDLGLSPTIARETARYHGGALSALAYRQLFRALNIIFAGIALLGGGMLFLCAGIIVNRWLHFGTLPSSEVLLAVQVMAVSVAFRWMAGLYRGVVMGAERIVWVSGYAAFMSTLRFLVVFGGMAWLGFTPTVFFSYQFVVSLVEVGGLWLMSKSLLPAKSDLTQPVGWSLKPVQPLLKFSLSIAFTTSIWVLITQTDKLVLSGILPLAEYGYFTIAVIVAGVITNIRIPITNSTLPLFTRLHAENRREDLIRLYRNSTQLVVLISGSVAITVAFYAEPLLFAWTGNDELAKSAAPILRLYALGNGVMAVGAFPYYLQYAFGNLRYHLIGNVVLLIFLIPSIIYAAIHWGGIGVGCVWLGVNAIYLLGWVGFVHYKLVDGLHGKWLAKDILPIIFLEMATCYLLSVIVNMHGERDKWVSILIMISFGCMVLAVSSLGSSFVRGYVRKKMLRWSTRTNPQASSGNYRGD